MSLIKQVKNRINRYHIVLAVFLLLGLLLRINNLGGDPLWKTEVYGSWAAKNFLEGHGFTHPSGQLYPRAWLTATLPIAASFVVFGVNEFAARLPSVIVGLSTVVVTYFLGREVGGEKTGLLSAGLVSLSYWMVTWDTVARMYAHSAFLYTLAVFLAYRWYDRDSFRLESWYLYALIPVSVIGLSNHILYSSIFPVVIAFIALVSIYNRYNSLEISGKENHIVIIAVLSALTSAIVALHGLTWLQGYTPAWYTNTRGIFYYLSYTRVKFFFAVTHVIQTCTKLPVPTILRVQRSLSLRSSQNP